MMAYNNILLSYRVYTLHKKSKKYMPSLSHIHRRSEDQTLLLCGLASATHKPPHRSFLLRCHTHTRTPAPRISISLRGHCCQARLRSHTQSHTSYNVATVTDFIACISISCTYTWSFVMDECSINYDVMVDK